jgi:hypothetical protein
MKLKNYITFFVILFLGSCVKKEEPVSQIGNALFYVSGEIDGAKLFIEAGNNNAVLESHIYTDSLNVKEFSSQLKFNCTDCKEKLSIVFRNFEVGNASSIDPDSIFKKEVPYAFYRNSIPPVGFRLELKNESNGIGNVKYLWDFGGGFGSLSLNPSFVFNSEGKKLIKLKAEYTDMGCVSDIENPVYINSAKLNDYIDFDYVLLPNNIFRCTVKNADSTTHRFVWRYLNNTLNSFPIGNTFELPAFVNEGVYKVDLLAIEKATNDTIFVSKNIATKNNVSCNANFSYKLVPVRDTLQLKTIKVSYTNKQGELFVSENIDQFGGFKVVETTNYIDAITNKKALKVKIIFNCKVYNGIRSLELTNMTAVLAFEY